jgi:hypothetical protein
MRRMRRWRLWSRAQGEVIDAVNSDDPRRWQWGADKILSSWLARDHPLAPARQRSAAADVSVQNNKTVNYTFRWRNSDDDKRDAEAAERERLRDEGKHAVSIGWEKPPEDDGKLIEAKPASED